MLIKRIVLMIIMLGMLVIPSSTMAKIKSCSEYSADKCPATSCRVSDGACVEAYVGEGFCTQKEVLTAMRTLGYFLFLVKILVPFIIIGFGIFDFYSAVIGGDTKAMTKSAQKLGARVGIGIFIFLVPTLLNIVLTAVDGYDDVLSDMHICQICILKPSECEEGIPDANIDPFSTSTESTTRSTTRTNTSVIIDEDDYYQNPAR